MDLRSLAGNFYEGAARCLELFEEEEIVDVLCEVCAQSTHNSREREIEMIDGLARAVGLTMCFGVDVQEAGSRDCGSCP